MKRRQEETTQTAFDNILWQIRAGHPFIQTTRPDLVWIARLQVRAEKRAGVTHKPKSRRR